MLYEGPREPTHAVHTWLPRGIRSSLAALRRLSAQADDLEHEPQRQHCPVIFAVVPGVEKELELQEIE